VVESAELSLVKLMTSDSKTIM